jgi:hypothetical protein
MRKILLMLLLGLANVSLAQIYKWTDDNGKTHITTTPPPKQYQKNTIVKETKSIDANSYEQKRQEFCRIGKSELERIYNVNIYQVDKIPEEYKGDIKDLNDKKKERIKEIQQDLKRFNC